METKTPPSKQWYAVRAISGQEKKIKQYILTELEREKLSAYVEEILIPTEKVVRMRQGKKKTIERNMMAGYILVLAELNMEVESAIREVPGVIGFLEGESKETEGKRLTKEERKQYMRPLPLRQSEVNRIRGKVEEMDEAGESLENPYRIGEEVKVMDGPFAGFSGNVEAVDEAKKKLKVMVKIFGRNTPLELNYFQVERATD